MASRADLYFFEELSMCLGNEIGHRWLEQQNRSKKPVLKSIVWASEVPCRTRSAPVLPVGRDVPNARLKVFQTSLLEKIDIIDSCKIKSEVARGQTVSLNLNKAGLNPLQWLTDIQENDSSVRSKLARSDSFERNVCLLFTDAAHKLLDKI
jgi:hypothetical protein